MIPDNIPDDNNPLLPESLIEPAVHLPTVSTEQGTQLPVETHVVPPFDQPAAIYSQYPEDLRAPWGWPDLLLLVAITVVGGFLVTFLEMSIFAMFGFTLQQVESSAEVRGLFLITTTLLISMGVLLYLVVQMRVRFRLPVWRTLGWGPLVTYGVPRPVVYLGLVVGGMTLSLLVTLISGVFAAKTKLPIQNVLQDRWSALFFLVLSVTIGPVFEETVFRGYIYPVLARSFGIAGGVFCTGTFFGLLHAQQLWGGWSQISLLVFVGIIFTYVRAASHTVVASYLLHVSYNSFLFIAFLVGTHGFRQFPPGS